VQSARTTDPLALLDALNGGKVEYIVVGGATAVLHGAPVSTQDLDIVYRLTRTNVRRLKRVLDQLHAVVAFARRYNAYIPSKGRNLAVTSTKTLLVTLPAKRARRTCQLELFTWSANTTPPAGSPFGSGTSNG
jgi:hypothetical protein